jgi:RNA polymerase sigma factor (sigma-70 family)
VAVLSLQSLIERLGHATSAAAENGDAELLRRFVARRDEAAFELLVWRHGAMVLNLCRRMLRSEQDAEDAFQATFLALAREAYRISSRNSLGGWLYRVAFRIALKLRTAGERVRPTPVPEYAGPDSTTEVDAADLRGVLDEEVRRLPAKYRLPFLLCCLEGRSNSEAALEIGCPRGTVDSRLSWAKRRLRDRLLRRGVGPAAAALALESLAGTDAAATVPTALIRDTVRSSFAFLGGAAGVLPAPAALARGVLHTMFLDRMKRTVLTLAAVAFLAGGAGWATFYSQAQDKSKDAKSPPADVQKADKHKPPPAPAPKPRESNAPAAGADVAGRNQAIRASLDRVVDIERPINASLHDVLEFLSDRFEVTIHVDDVAFRRLDPPVENVEEMPVKLHKQPGSTLHNILDMILKEFDGTAIVKRGAIYVVPVRSNASVMTSDGPVSRGLFDRVKLSQEEQPFADAIRYVVDQTGANIVIDGRAKELTKKTVSAHLQDAPLLTAVRVLADSIDLAVVTRDNVIYITTPENALKWKTDHPARSTIPAPKSAAPELPTETKKM